MLALSPRPLGIGRVPSSSKAAPACPSLACSLVPHAAGLAGPGANGAGGGVSSGVGAGAGAGSGTPMDRADGADGGRQCQMGSYGDMVACDDNECECEWVSVSSNEGLFASGWVLSDILATSSTWDALGSRLPLRAYGFCEACRVKT